ncbi:YihY/virulence factor BrkB family protein [Catenulispora subtropica]|uniref:YihY/virulence factor BrkB family protein n=1 Tax=Catenulispora subtropica TaxID=450798 RepID=A0ABP5DXI1_9ACTN
MSIGDRIHALTRRLDTFQQRHTWLAFPVAVWRKLSDDQVGDLAALLTFYAFLSLFPLLLLLVTVLGFALHRDPALQQWVLRSALADFPVIGDELRGDIHAVGRGPAGLVAGLIGSLLGARGLADAAQNVLNRLWAVPYNRRPGFPWSWLRSYGFIAVVGVGMAATSLVADLATSLVADLAGGVGSGPLAIGARAAALLVALLIGTLTYWLALRLAIAGQVRGRDLWTGALLGAVGWQILQTIGGYYITHQLRHASSLYGAFGLVLGLIAWLYLQARVTLYAVAADVVRARRFWPRSVFPPPTTIGDRKAWASAMAAQDRSPVNEPPPRMNEEGDRR